MFTVSPFSPGQADPACRTLIGGAAAQEAP